jgi:hypothetical protein
MTEINKPAPLAGAAAAAAASPTGKRRGWRLCALAALASLAAAAALAGREWAALRATALASVDRLAVDETADGIAVAVEGVTLAYTAWAASDVCACAFTVGSAPPVAVAVAGGGCARITASAPRIASARAVITGATASALATAAVGRDPVAVALSCTVRVRLIPGVWEPAVAVARAVDVGGAAGAGTSPAAVAPAGDPSAVPPLVTLPTPASPSFSAAFAWDAPIGPALASAAGAAGVALTSASVRLTGVAAVATSPGVGTLAAVRLHPTDWAWDASSGVPLEAAPGGVAVTAGAAPDRALAAAGAAGGVDAVLGTTLAGILPAPLAQLVADVAGGAPVSSDPLDVVVLAAAAAETAVPADGDPAPGARAAPLEAAAAAVVDAAAAAATPNDDPSPPSAPCSGALALLHAVLSSAGAGGGGGTAAPCAAAGPVLTAQVVVEGSVGGGAGGAARRRRLAPRRSLSPAAAALLRVTLATPDLTADVGSMSAALSAEVTATAPTTFLSAAAARLLSSCIGTYALASRVETHIAPVWRRGVTDRLGAVVGVAAPRPSTLWSTTECGAARLTVGPVLGGAPDSFTLRGTAHLSGLWRCFDAVAREYMVGRWAGTPLAGREVAIKPDAAPDEPKGAVRVVFPLVGTMSLPLGIASRRWMKAPWAAAGGGGDLALPAAAGGDVLPPAALAAHGARVFPDPLVLTDLNCSAPRCAGVDGSGGRVARAWAVSSHPAADISALTPFLSAGCATDAPGSPLCAGFEKAWRRAGYLGVDGLLLSGACAGGVFLPTTTCLALEFSADEFGVSALGMARGGGASTYDPWRDAAVPAARPAGSVLLQQTTAGGPVPRARWTGIELATLFRWAGEGGAGWSGVRVTAATLFAWARAYIAEDADPPVWAGAGLGPVPRVDGRACYSPSVGGFSIRASRDCFLAAVRPWAAQGLATLGTATAAGFRGAATVRNILTFAGETLPGKVLVNPVVGALMLLQKHLFSQWTTAATDGAPTALASPAASAVRFFALLPSPIVTAVALIPSTIARYGGGALWHLLSDDLSVAGFDADGTAVLAGAPLGAASARGGIGSWGQLDAFVFSETFTSVNNGSAWRAVARLLCAAAGDAAAGVPPSPRPLDLTIAGTARALGTAGCGNGTGGGSSGGCGEPDGLLQVAAAPFTVDAGGVVDAADALVSAAAGAVWPPWTADGGFARPVSDFAWLVATSTASEVVFGRGGPACPAPAGLTPAPSPTPSRRPLVIASRSPSATPAPTGGAFFVWLTIRVTGLPAVAGGIDGGALPPAMLIALRRDVSCGLGIDPGRVRVIDAAADGAGAATTFAAGAAVNVAAPSDALSDAAAAAPCAPVDAGGRRLAAGSVAGRAAQAAAATAGAVAVTLVAVVPRVDAATGAATGLGEADALDLQSRALAFLAAAAAEAAPGAPPPVAAALPAVAATARDVDAGFDATTMTVTALAAPAVTEAGAAPAPPVAPGAAPPADGSSPGELVGAGLAGAAVVAAAVVAVAVALHRARARSGRARAMIRRGPADWRGASVGSLAAAGAPTVVSTTPLAAAGGAAGRLAFPGGSVV